MAEKPTVENTESGIQGEEILDSYYPSFLDADNKDMTDEEKAANYVLERFRSMSKARTPQEEKWTTAESNYRVVPGATPTRNNKNQWRSTHTVPITHGIVETAVAEYSDANPDIIIANRLKADAYKGDVMGNIFKYTQFKGDFKVEKLKAFRELAIYGTVIWEEFYREDPSIVRDPVDYDPETNKFTYEIKKTTKFNDVYGRVCNIWDIYVDERAEDFTDAEDVIKREVLTMNAFKMKYGKYEPVKKDEIKAGGETTQKDAFPKEEGDAVDKIEVFTYTNQVEDVQWIVANGKLVNPFDTANPFMHKELPYARGVNILMPHKFYGMGIPEIIAGVQSEINTLRRMALDREKLDINKPSLSSGRQDLTEEEAGMYPGKVLQVADVDKSFKQLDTTGPGQGRYQEEDLLKEDARYGSGVSNPSSANTTGATATESAIVKEATLKRLRSVLAVNEVILLTRIGKLRVKNIQQFYKDPVKVQKVTGEGGKTEWVGEYRQVGVQKDSNKPMEFFSIDPEWIRGDFEFSIQSYSTIPLSQALEEQRSEQVFDRLTNPVMMQVIDPRKLAIWFMKKHSEDPRKVMMENLDTPDEALADEENAKMMMGVELPPTPGATPEHTAAHLAYVERYAFQIDDAKDDIFTKHIDGEKVPVSPAGMGQNLPPITNGPEQGMDPNALGAPPEGADPNALPPEMAGAPGPGGMPVEGGIPGQEGGGNPLTPDMSFDGQLSKPNQQVRK